MQRTVARLLKDKGTEIWSIGPEDSVYAALELMADKNIGALLVLDGEKLVGIMSERDYARKVVLKSRVSKKTPVKDIMTPDVHTVTSDLTTTDCMQLMTDERIRHLPVMGGEQVVGVISIGDVVRSVIQEQRFMIEQLERYITR